MKESTNRSKMYVFFVNIIEPKKTVFYFNIPRSKSFKKTRYFVFNALKKQHLITLNKLVHIPFCFSSFGISI